MADQLFTEGVLAEAGRLQRRPSDSTMRAALNVLDSAAEDRLEPERYREWYADAARELRELWVEVPQQDEETDR